MTSDARLLEPARVLAGLTIRDLWFGYLALGGEADVAEMEAYLTGALVTEDREYDFLAQAINDRFTDIGMDHPVPYSEP